MMLTQIRNLDTSSQAFFRFRPVGKKVLITNQQGSFLLLEPEEFTLFSEGKVEEGSELYAKLSERNFLRATFDEQKAADALRRRKTFLAYGPNLFIMVVTLRCNETCVYCHASRADMNATHTDMTRETAEKSVDLILQSTSPGVTIEFQGGEPLVNFEVVRHTIEYALEKNKSVGKTLEFTMVTNLALMTEEKLDYLVRNRVQLCTSIDGPEHLHDRQRKLPALSAHKAAVQWIGRINEKYVEMGLDPSLYHVEALLTTTRETLPLWKEVIDTYVALGCRAIFLRPVDPFGFAQKTAHKVEYPRAEYMAFYRKALDYILELNQQGVQVLERYAAIFLTKILTGDDPNFLDIRNPGAAGLGQMAFSYDGKIFTCDEGRMLYEMGDDSFHIGHVDTTTYRDLVGHQTVRSVLLASNLDGQPDCVHCTYNPFCGVPPVHTHKTQGHIFGHMRESTLCAVHKGIQDILFEKLGEGDTKVLETLERWTINRPRTHFLQDLDSSGAAA